MITFDSPSRRQAVSESRSSARRGGLRGGLSVAALVAAGVLGLSASQARADPTAECNVGSGTGSTECGVESNSAGEYSTVVGDHSTTNGVGAVVVGAGSGVNADGGVAIGRATYVTPDGGPGTVVYAPVPDVIGGVAIGDIARASGSDNVALGGFSVVGVRDQFTTVNGGTAIGAGTNVAADGGTTLGARSEVQAGATNAVAIGAGSIADQANTVSFGTVGNERRLVNIADGVAASDAATVGQMNASAATTLGSANSHADAGDAATLTAANSHADAGDAATLTAANTYADTGDAMTLSAANAYADVGDAATLDAANAYTDSQLLMYGRRLDDVRKRADSGTAAALAAANIPQAFAPGKSMIGAGVGYWRGESALSIGASHLMGNGRVTLRGSATFAGSGGSGGGVGVGFSF
jgi:autotransporter adhesin